MSLLSEIPTVSLCPPDSSAEAQLTVIQPEGELWDSCSSLGRPSSSFQLYHQVYLSIYRDALNKVVDLEGSDINSHIVIFLPPLGSPESPASKMSTLQSLWANQIKCLPQLSFKHQRS